MRYGDIGNAELCRAGWTRLEERSRNHTELMDYLAVRVSWVKLGRQAVEQNLWERHGPMGQDAAITGVWCARAAKVGKVLVVTVRPLRPNGIGNGAGMALERLILLKTESEAAQGTLDALGSLTCAI